MDQTRQAAPPIQEPGNLRVFHFQAGHVPLRPAYPALPGQPPELTGMVGRGLPGLLCVFGCAGYGRLRPEGVRRELERMATESVDQE